MNPSVYDVLLIVHIHQFQKFQSSRRTGFIKSYVFLALSNIRAAKVNFNIFEFERLCVTQHVISNLRTMGDSDCSFTFYSRSAVNIFSRVRETNSTNTRALICKRGGGNNAFKELPCLANQPNELFVIICTKTPTDHRTLDGKKFKNQSGC